MVSSYLSFRKKRERTSSILLHLLTFFQPSLQDAGALGTPASHSCGCLRTVQVFSYSIWLHLRNPTWGCLTGDIAEVVSCLAMCRYFHLPNHLLSSPCLFCCYSIPEVAGAKFLPFLLVKMAPAGWVPGRESAGGQAPEGESSGPEQPRGMHPAWLPATAGFPEPVRSHEVCEQLGRSRNICDVNLALVKKGISCPAHKTFVLPAADEEPQRLRQRIRPFP